MAVTTADQAAPQHWEASQPTAADPRVPREKDQSPRQGEDLLPGIQINRELIVKDVKNKSCDEALGAAQGSQEHTDLDIKSLRAWVFELGWTIS